MAKVRLQRPEIHIDIDSHNARLNNPASKKDARFSIQKEYVGHPSGKPVYVLRFVSHYIASTPLKKDAVAMKNAVVSEHEKYPLTVAQMQNIAEPYSDVKRSKNPVKPRSPSRLTGKAPSKRLVARRKKNDVPGYYPNPATPNMRGWWIISVEGKRSGEWQVAAAVANKRLASVIGSLIADEMNAPVKAEQVK